ncbi:plasmalemma vesicle associated protein b [Gadus macrocephalus]|uniref:plasmalemma vesicle associated protein b n=1 Tax=Gadus macrocephalus TaxID=80720 RepID=UPI0028CB526D|nr:plasmalemma vesicle associated protein b [Gadus macrocephalus]
MYSSSYPRARLGLDPLHKARGKSCGYYMRIVFFFSSLIQSLIIASLVLFLVYGQPEKSAEELRITEMEQNFNQLSGNNIQLRKEKGELGAQLGAAAAQKAALEKEVAQLKTSANSSAKLHQAGQKKLVQCEEEKRLTLTRCAAQPQCPPGPPVNPFALFNNERKVLQSLNEQQRAMLRLLEANFTQTVTYLSQERDGAIRDRDAHNQEAIATRQHNLRMQEQLSAYTRKCKEDFAKSLEGIQTVTSAFLARINDLFPHHLTFHLTCAKQQEQMEKTRANCTNLSREVEDRFQKYLNVVGDQVANIQALSSKLEVQSSQLTSDLQTCEQTRVGMAAKSDQLVQEAQKTHDTRMKTILLEQNRLREEKQLMAQRLAMVEGENRRVQNLGALPNCKQGQVTKPMPGSG